MQVVMLEKQVMVCIDVEQKQCQQITKLSSVHVCLIQIAARNVCAKQVVIIFLL
jgi:hypothetical protein